MHASDLHQATALQPAAAAAGDLWSYVERARPSIEETLERFLPLAPAAVGTRFNEALRWSLFPGGKRLRPVLTMLGAEIVGGRGEGVLPAAAGVEYIHTSSLIFDDLPCMDDAAERRGRASVHQRYGQGLAILVALGLMNASYGLIFETDVATPDAAIMAHKEFVECIGTNGMVVGQTIDLAEFGETNASMQMRNLKTSALMRMALRTGAMLAGGDAGDLQALSRFAESIGDAYQLRDDIADAAEDDLLAVSARRARTSALDDGAAKATRRVEELVAEAKRPLVQRFGDTKPTRHLAQMADYIAARA